MRLPLQSSERRTFLIIVDFAMVLFAVLLALWIWTLRAGHPLDGTFVRAQVQWFPLLAGLWLLLAFLNDFYNLESAADRKASLVTLVRITGLEMMVYLLIYFFSPPQRPLPRGIVLYHAMASSILVGLWRAICCFLFTQATFQHRTLVVGAGWAGRTIVQAIREKKGTGLHLLGFIDDDPAKREQSIEGLPVIGTRDALLSLVKAKGVTQIILAITHDLHADLFRALIACNEQGVEITPMPLAYEEVTGKVPVQHIGDHWLVVLPLNHAAANSLFPILKRVFDVSISLAGLIMLSLLFPFVALAIYMDSPGPIFYLQERVGQDKKVYRLIKLRTMVPHAEKDGQAVWAKEQDPRVTRVGRILRTTHIDELPQFINILKGEMSVVGPRPERPEFVAELEEQIPFYRLRHSVRPGATGWAFINSGYGRSVEDALVKIQYDLYYIKHQSLYLDLLILLKTLGQVFLLQGSRRESMSTENVPGQCCSGKKSGLYPNKMPHHK